MKNREIFPVCLLLVILCTACRPELGTGTFIKDCDAPDGRYSFVLDFSDSTLSRDIEFYTRSRRKDDKSYPLFVTWTSPSGKSYCETVYMRVGSVAGVREKYRTNTIPVEPGEWILTVAPQCRSDLLFGFGVIY